MDAKDVESIGTGLAVLGGERQVRFRFTNGYGASVISDGYGGDRGLFELAVLDRDGLCYNTPITSDVIGWQTAEQIAGLLRQIAALPKAPPKEKRR